MFQNVRPKQHTNYSRIKNIRDLEPIYDALRVPYRLPKGTYQTISNQSHVPISTLKKWRKKLLENDKINHVHGAPNVSHVLPKEIEDKIYEQIFKEKIENKIYCNKYTIKKKALDIAKDYPKFKAGHSWIIGFMKRYNLSLRSPHVRRRTAPNDTIVSKFLSDFDVALLQFDRKCIYNMDECAWRISNGHLKTITRKGSDEVVIFSQEELKTTITIIATINLSGDKLALCLIAHGKTEKCEKKYRTDKRLRRYIKKDKLVIFHSESGWATSNIMDKYLKFLAKQNDKNPSYLLFDLHSSHRDEQTKFHANFRNINLSYIPAGLTSFWQPLDRRIFGHLKKKCQEQFEILLAEKSLEDVDIIDALVILLDTWEKFPRTAIIGAWSHLVQEQDNDEYEYQNEEEEEKEIDMIEEASS